MRASCGVLEVALCVLLLAPTAGCGGDDSVAAAGTGGVGAPLADGVPCDVAAVIGPKCTLCHGPVAKFGSPLSLMKPADFQVPIDTVMAKASIKTQFAGKKVFEVASALINSTVVADKMPPVPQAELTPEELTLLTNWLNAGAMAGPCAIMPK